MVDTGSVCLYTFGIMQQLELTKAPVTIILGTTAIGKTEYALQLANQQGAHIISADAFQIYRTMDIGTAKVSQAERERIPHYLVDIKNPDDSWSVAEFLSRTHAILADLQARRIPAVICGGTAYYLWAFLYDFQFDELPVDTAFRDAQLKRAGALGAEVLWAELSAADPERAACIHPNDTRRIVRALEILHSTGHRPSEQHIARANPRTDVTVIGLEAEREWIYSRINQRVDSMIKEGLVAEVQDLIRRGYGADLPAMSALGYREVYAHLSGSINHEQMVELIKRNTRRFAKRQLIWYRRFVNVHWIKVD